MIHPLELRNGNRIEYRGNHASFDGTFCLEFGQHVFETNEWELLEPIPLSPEILLEWGFEALDSEIDYMRYGIPGKYISIYNDGGFIGQFESAFFFSYEDGLEKIEVKSLHQLQNLYFALTGEELKRAK